MTLENSHPPVTAESTHFVPYRREAVLPPTDLAGLRGRAASLLPQIAAGAAARERDRVMPYAWLRRIAEHGLYTWRVPRAYGGPGGGIVDVIRFVIDVASVDSNVAQSLRPGFGFIETLLANAGHDAEGLDRWLPRILAGQIVGNAGWERGGPNGRITARLTADDPGAGDGWRISGRKYYSTGALYADHVMSFALDDDDQEAAFIVPRDRPGLQLVDDFDAAGQRLTASGTTVFDRVEVRRDERRPPIQRDRRSPIPALYQLFLAAVEAGIARNAHADAVRFAREVARPIKHSSAARSVDDPYVQLSVGEISSAAFAAEAVTLEAARALDAAWAAELDADALTDAAARVAQAQVVAVQSALRAAELAFDVGGASATDRAHNLDRHWRNARTVANHNPRHWKAAMVGRWQLTDEPLPTSGLF